jgi:hypothetical protein
MQFAIVVITGFELNGNTNTTIRRVSPTDRPHAMKPVLTLVVAKARI